MFLNFLVLVLVEFCFGVILLGGKKNLVTVERGGGDGSLEHLVAVRVEVEVLGEFLEHGLSDDGSNGRGCGTYGRTQLFKRGVGFKPIDV